jgi:hypothetical protein
VFVASVIGTYFTNQADFSVFQETSDLNNHELRVQVEFALAEACRQGIVVECVPDISREQKLMTQHFIDKSSNLIFTFSTSKWRTSLLSLMFESKKQKIEQIIKNLNDEFHPGRNRTQNPASPILPRHMLISKTKLSSSPVRRNCVRDKVEMDVRFCD